MLITSAVAILFSCSDWDTHRSQSLAIGRATRPLVTLKGLMGVVSLKQEYDAGLRKVPPCGFLDDPGRRQDYSWHGNFVGCSSSACYENRTLIPLILA